MASTKRLADRVGFLHEGKIIFYGTYGELVRCKLPPVHAFVEGAQTSRLARREVTTAPSEAPAPDRRAADRPSWSRCTSGRRQAGAEGHRSPDLPAADHRLIGASGSGKS